MSSVRVDQGGSGTTGQVQEKAQQVAGQVQEAADQAKSQVREQVDQRSSQWGDQIKSTANDLRSVAEELRNRDKEPAAKLADQAASRVESVGQYLSESDADRLLSDVEDFARRQPWVVVAVGAGLGLVASRFLKASSRQRYDSYYTSTRTRAELRDSVGYPVVTDTVSTGYTDPTAVPPAPPLDYPAGTGTSTLTDPYDATGTSSSRTRSTETGSTSEL